LQRSLTKIRALEHTGKYGIVLRNYSKTKFEKICVRLLKFGYFSDKDDVDFRTEHLKHFNAGCKECVLRHAVFEVGITVNVVDPDPDRIRSYPELLASSDSYKDEIGSDLCVYYVKVIL
jgi:hypothetical protein